jgi:hypothetical protein
MEDKVVGTLSRNEKIRNSNSFLENLKQWAHLGDLNISEINPKRNV